MKMIFMGRKHYAAEMLKWTIGQGIEVVLVCTDDQFPNSPTMKVAKEHGIPVVSMEEAEAYAASHAEELDLVISYLYWRKIRKPLIEIPRYGCINFHPAILPDWRGTAGYNIAILKKLPAWGATAHYVDESVDTGAIIRVYKFDFDWRHETACSLEKKTQSIQMDLYKSVITDVTEQGRLQAETQDRSQGVYISRKEMNGMKAIDLKNIEDADLDLMIRAFWFPPYDGACIEVGGKRYTLVNESILKSLQSEDQTAQL